MEPNLIQNYLKTIQNPITYFLSERSCLPTALFETFSKCPFMYSLACRKVNPKTQNCAVPPSPRRRVL